MTRRLLFLSGEMRKSFLLEASTRYEYCYLYIVDFLLCRGGAKCQVLVDQVCFLYYTMSGSREDPEVAGVGLADAEAILWPCRRLITGRESHSESILEYNYSTTFNIPVQVQVVVIYV